MNLMKSVLNRPIRDAFLMILCRFRCCLSKVGRYSPKYSRDTNQYICNIRSLKALSHDP